MLSGRIVSRGLVIAVVSLSALVAQGQQVALEQDARVIQLLRRNGSDFSKPHPVDYYFVMPDASSAEAIAARLEALGCVVQRIKIPPRRFSWEVHVQRLQLVQLGPMQATSRQFSELAKQFGGYYDGWGEPSVK